MNRQKGYVDSSQGVGDLMYVSAERGSDDRSREGMKTWEKGVA